MPPSSLLGVTRRMAYVRVPKSLVNAGGSSWAAGSAKQQAYSSSSSSGVLTMARLDGAGNAPTADTLEQQLREAFLELQLAAAAAEGAAWAGLDLAGLPRAAGVQQLAQYRQDYDTARCRLQRCRPPAEVARQEALMAAEWHWLRRVRMAATAAASSCSKQGIMRRPPPPSEFPAWQLTTHRPAAAGCSSQQHGGRQAQPRVRFSSCVQQCPAAVLPAEPAAATASC
ncbi:hypothetical protein OEZ85_004777 [Tetradesmus obliquus]|uniref:Uncharacterized protein n=1 Tax=Tetradesmus obliquus TaxID=3088 RepID=A0ABY8ULZ3_TETOB|nr:hypothetical protein OEZ85_004777 [Tetradesmus obliquus]